MTSFSEFKSFITRIEKIPAVVYAICGWIITIVTASISTTDWVSEGGGMWFLLFLLPLVVFLPCLSIYHAAKSFELSDDYLVKVVELYAVLALVFANLYFVLIVIHGEIQIYEKIHTPWTYLEWPQGRRLYIQNILLTAVDCIYFSFATITTSAYGDIKPLVWYTKLLSNIEVIAGLYLVTIGIGRYFSKANITKNSS